MNSKLLWGIVILVVVGTVGLIVWAARQPASQITQLAQPVNANDWSKGPTDAKAVLVEYGDFQCPACAQFYPIVKQLLGEYKDQVRFVYRHFPLSQHANAKPSAYAAEAAGQQGKFWEMSDKLYTNQSAWVNLSDPTEVFTGYARDLGLELNQFKTAMASQAVKDKVDQQTQGGTISNLTYTPTFFLNGKVIQPAGYVEFRAAIEAALK